MKITTKTPVAAIASALEADGYNPELAPAVKAAAIRGCLLWTAARLTTTDSSRIDERPRAAEVAS